MKSVAEEGGEFVLAIEFGCSHEDFLRIVSPPDRAGAVPDANSPAETAVLVGQSSGRGQGCENFAGQDGAGLRDGQGGGVCYYF